MQRAHNTLKNTDIKYFSFLSILTAATNWTGSSSTPVTVITFFISSFHGANLFPPNTKEQIPDHQSLVKRSARRDQLVLKGLSHRGR